MATDLTTVFGNKIKVYSQPRQAARQFVGFPGGHGVVAMHLGSRGYQFVISGIIAATGANYAAARANVQAIIDSIEPYLWADAADYSFKGTTYSNIVFVKFQLVPDSNGKAFHWTSEGWVTCSFICYARSLV